nr:hypothetical protein GCM10020092_004260 [Actinoplanes digitatis]
MTHATGTRTGQAGSRARPTFRGFVDDDSDAVVTVRAFDAAGNMASLTTTVHVDNKVPKLAGLSPAVGTVMRTGPIDIALAEVAADAVKVEMTEGQRGASLVTKTETPWTFHWEGLDKTESPCFRATDKARQRIHDVQRVHRGRRLLHQECAVGSAPSAASGRCCTTQGLPVPSGG